MFCAFCTPCPRCQTPPAVIMLACFALSRVSVAVSRFLCSGGICAYPVGEMQWRAVYAAVTGKGGLLTIDGLLWLTIGGQ